MRDRFVRMNGWSQSGLVLTIISLLIWGWVALTMLAYEYCAVAWQLAWIPAVATSGVMMSSTALSMTAGLDESIRRYAERLAYAGISGDILGAGAYHYIEAARMQPDPLLAVPVGGIPCLMGGLLIHVWSLVQKQRRREIAEVEQAEIERQRRVQAAEAAERQRVADEAAEDRRRTVELAHQQKVAAATKLAAEEMTRKAAAELQIAAAVEQRASTARQALEPSKPHLVVDNTKRKPAAKSSGSPVRDAAIEYLITQHRAGRSMADIGPAEVRDAIGAKYDTVKSSLAAWKSAVTELVEAVG